MDLKGLPMSPRAIAAVIKERRRELGWSTAELATRLYQKERGVRRAQREGLQYFPVINHYFKALGLEVTLNIRSQGGDHG